MRVMCTTLSGRAYVARHLHTAASTKGQAAARTTGAAAAAHAAAASDSHNVSAAWSAAARSCSTDHAQCSAPSCHPDARLPHILLVPRAGLWMSRCRSFLVHVPGVMLLCPIFKTLDRAITVRATVCDARQSHYSQSQCL